MYITAPGHFDKSYQPMGRLFYLNKDGQVTQLAHPLTYPNGIAIYKDQLYVAEHLAQRIIKYQILAPGKIGQKTLFTKTTDAPRLRKSIPKFTGPDGIEISKKGTVYVAEYGAGRMLVYDQKGALQKTKKARLQFVTNITLTPDETRLIITGAHKLDGFLQAGEVYEGFK